VIPQSVELIRSRAFYNCQSAQFLSLGARVAEIESDAFSSYESNAFRHIVLLTATPPTLSTQYCWGGISHDVVITVPCGSMPAYEAAPFWDEFTNFTENCDAIDDNEMDDVQIYTANGNIVVTGLESGEVEIYDLSGRIIAHEMMQNCGQNEISIPTSGVYIVVIDRKTARKVFVL